VGLADDLPGYPKAASALESYQHATAVAGRTLRALARLEQEAGNGR
jgi:hypothetical protein